MKYFNLEGIFYYYCNNYTLNKVIWCLRDYECESRPVLYNLKRDIAYPSA